MTLTSARAAAASYRRAIRARRRGRRPRRPGMLVPHKAAEVLLLGRDSPGTLLCDGYSAYESRRTAATTPIRPLLGSRGCNFVGRRGGSGGGSRGSSTSSGRRTRRTPTEGASQPAAQGDRLHGQFLTWPTSLPRQPRGCRSITPLPRCTARRRPQAGRITLARAPSGTEIASSISTASSGGQSRRLRTGQPRGAVYHAIRGQRISRSYRAPAEHRSASSGRGEHL